MLYTILVRVIVFTLLLFRATGSRQETFMKHSECGLGRITSHAYRKIEGADRASCAVECSGDGHCISFSYDASSNRCLFSSSRAGEGCQNLHALDGGLYYEATSPRCVHGAPLSGLRCSCAILYVGDRCEVNTGAKYALSMDKMTGATIIGVKLIATLHNGAKLVEGLKGSSLHLNGVNQWASLGIHEQSCLGNLRLCAEGFSVAFWVKYETVPRDGNYRFIYFLSSGGQSHANGIAVCYVDNGAEGSLRFMAKLASQNQVVQMWRADVQVDGATFPSSKWSHLVMTLKKDHPMSVYVDGLRKARVPSASVVIQTANYELVLGRSNDAMEGFGNFTLDELMFWESQIDQNLVSKLASKP